MPVRYSNGPETRRILHRELTAADAKFFYQLNSHPDVMRFTGDQVLGNEDQARHALQQYPDFDEVGYGRWGCVLKTNQQLIGFCGLKYLPEQDAVDIGYRFFPEYWGQGLATEAASACLGFGFQIIGLKQILGIALPENLASIRVLKKLGMKRDGDFIEGNLRLLTDTCAWQTIGQHKTINRNKLCRHAGRIHYHNDAAQTRTQVGDLPISKSSSGCCNCGWLVDLPIW